MKEFIKYFHYRFICLIIIFFLNTIIIVTSNADIINPNNEIEPYQVVEIQLKGLMRNNDPFEDAGIEQTWQFAHPNNKKYTGPIEKFKTMLKGASYSMLLNHSDHQVVEVYLSEEVATYEVIVLDVEKKYYKFKWQVEKYNKEGPLKDCWLTTAVSQPVSLGSSI